MNSWLGLRETVQAVEDLGAGMRECCERAERLASELSRHTTRLEQQHRKELADIDREWAAGREAAETRWQDTQRSWETRQRRRQDRILGARRAAERVRLDAIASEESREIFHLQRELLKVSRDQEAGRQQVDAELAVFQAAWGEARAAVDQTDAAIEVAFRGYASMRHWLADPEGADDPLPATAANALLEQCQKLQAEAVDSLARFRRRPLPRLFSVLSPWLLGGLAVGLHGAAVFLLPRFSTWSVPWQQAGTSLGVTLVALAALHWIGGRLAGPSARTLARRITRARVFLEAAHHAADTEHRRSLERLETEARIRSEAIQQRWDDVRSGAERQREALQRRLEERSARAKERSEQILRQHVDRGRQSHEQTLGRLDRDAESRREALGQAHANARGGLGTHRADDWAAIERDWRDRTTQAWRVLTEAATAVQETFPAWSDAKWDVWSPPAEFLSAALLGHLEVSVGELAGGVPCDPRLKFPGDSTAQLPLLLRLPDQASVLFETQEQGRDLALSSLNNLVLRLLLAAPPGRVLFTILDPVGLGESFAGLMHLTDHEDRLVNRRIWTQPDHIEQRLADLNEHIEKVTQLYLRNEYATIADYNQQAGRIAEPYHFLVVADFPVHFSDLAVRRLLSLASSGPRCGVFTLVHWDSRRPAPQEFVADDLRQVSIQLRSSPQGFVLANQPPKGANLRLESPPSPARVTHLLQQVGRLSIDSNRVEMPFEQIAPPEPEIWTHETTTELRVPIGVTGATKLQYLAVGKGTRQHVLIAGKTGSGKSTLFHVLVTNLALWSSPEQVEFYLVDFKKGVEFKCYATHRLPHARVVAIESDREFGLSVLQRVDQELHRRGDLFRQSGVQDLAGYLRVGGQPLPRTLVIIDEFQEFFTEDDRVSQNAALLLDRLVRQGRAFGIHVLLGSQTLGGAYTLARTTLGQMVVRIALQCNQADALLIMDDDNPAPRLLSRPGEAIYNDASGALEGNSPFQVVWLNEAERETQLKRIRKHAERRTVTAAEFVVFEGNAPADVRENADLARLLAEGPREPTPPARIWLGAPNSIKGPTEIVFRRQNGSNLLVVGQNDEACLAMVGLGLLTLAARHAENQARIVLLEASPQGSPPCAFLEDLVHNLPIEVTLVTHANLEAVMGELADELTRRSESGDASTAPSIYLAIHHLQRFKALRYEDDFAISLEDTANQAPGAVLNRILTDGTHLGFHVVCVCDGFNNASRFLSRKALSEFELRVLFQMSASDSASLMDDPKASTLGLHRAVLFNSQEGTLETFRPYAMPDPAWLQAAKRQLAQRTLAGGGEA